MLTENTCLGGQTYVDVLDRHKMEK